MSVNQNLMF